MSGEHSTDHPLMTGHQARRRGILFAALAAVFYALNAPLAKLLIADVAPTMLAALLYLGAGLGMAAAQGIERLRGSAPKEQPLTRQELPYAVAMILLDIAAPIALMMGIQRSSAASVSLLNNFEIVITSLAAWLFFRERVSRRLWLGIGLVTLSTMVLSLQDLSGLRFSLGSLYVLLASLCWGFENNCTRRMASKDPRQIVILKGLFSGLGALLIALALGERLPALGLMLLSLLLGFVTYGMSIYLYIYAQRELGAAKTSAYYAIAPFVGVALSFLIFLSLPGLHFFLALLIMAAGSWLVTRDWA